MEDAIEDIRNQMASEDETLEAATMEYVEKAASKGHSFPEGCVQLATEEKTKKVKALPGEESSLAKCQKAKSSQSAGAEKAVASEPSEAPKENQASRPPFGMATEKKQDALQVEVSGPG